MRAPARIVCLPLVALGALGAAVAPVRAQAPPAAGADCPIVAAKPRPSGVRLVEGPFWSLRRARLLDPDSLALAPGALVDPAKGTVHFVFRFDGDGLDEAGWERATAEVAGTSYELVAMGPSTRKRRGDRFEESLLVSVPIELVEQARQGVPVAGWLFGLKSREFDLDVEQSVCLGRLLDTARAALGSGSAAAAEPSGAPVAPPAPAAGVPAPPLAPAPPVARPPDAPPSPVPPAAQAVGIAPAAPVAPVAEPPLPLYLRELRELARLRDEGILTQEEFERKKRQVLERSEEPPPPRAQPDDPPGKGGG